MAGKLTLRQRQIIRKESREHELDPSEMAGELNIVPFLDIVVNLIMFLLMTTAALAFFAQIQANLPEYKSGVGKRGAANPSLNLNLTLTQNGIIVAGSGGKLAPGCETTATGRILTVVNTANGQYDWSGLSACVTKVKSQFPDEHQVIISADPLVEYQYVVRAMDAVRAENGKELFPDVMLSAGVR